MDELTLIKLTQYAFASLNKGLPKGYVLKASDEHTVEFYKYDTGKLWQNTGRPVGFYFESKHTFELRSRYDGNELIIIKGNELDDAINCL